MFDANMRYIPFGRRFFAELIAPDANDKVSHGLNQGDVVLCYMCTEGPKNPSVIMMVNSDHIEASCRSTGHAWFIYAGRTDGSGFIDDGVKDKALSILGGNWDQP